TLDPAFRVAEAVAIAGDRVAAVGASAELLALAAPNTHRVGLGGRAVVPGLVDAHAHMDREGLKAVCPSLAGAASIDDVLQRVEALVRATAPDEWIVTMPLGDPPYYFDVPTNLKEGRFPTRWELDRVAPRNPVYIRAIWGYWRHTLPLVSIANSEALRRAGVTRETVPPWEGVTIEKDSRGEPTGIFVEQTYMPLVELSLMAAAPRFSHAERVRALSDSMRIYAATGPTRVVEGRGAGDAFLRVAGLVGEANPTLDNAVRARAMPYTGWAGFAYDAALPRAALREVLREAARREIRVASMGTDLLDLYEDVNRVMPIRDRRWVVEHISTLTADEIARIRDL